MPIVIGPGIELGPGVKITAAPPVLGSALFNGTTQYLTATLPNAPGTGAYTVEWWSYVTDWSNPTNLNFFDTRIGTTDENGFSVNVVGTQLRYRVSGTLGTAASYGGMALNNWYHMAVVRSGTTNTLYINGSSTITLTDGGDLSRTALTIGRSFDTYYIKGYVSNFRYVQGVAVYTGNFTPPSQPLAATQTPGGAGTNISAITAGQTNLLLNTPNNAFNLTDTSSYSVTVNNNNGVTANASTPF